MADTKLDVIVKVKDEFTSDMKKIGGNVDSVRDKFKTAGAAITGVGVAGGLMIKSVAGASATMESMGVAMKTAFQGDSAAAKAAMDRIKEFANTTPYGLQEVTGAFLKLKNLGLDPSEAALTSYGNTASSMGKSLNDMIEAVADASTGEFERLKEFGIRTKVEGDKVKFTFQGITTEVGNNAEEIEGYLQGIGNTQFAGGMEAQSQTLGGQLSTLKDAFFNLQASIGDTMAGPLKALTGIFTELAASIGTFVEENPRIASIVGTIMLLVTGLALIGGPILLLIGFLPTLAAGFSLVGVAITFMTGPIGIAIAIIAVLVTAFIMNFDTIKAVAKAFVEDLAQRWNEFSSKIEEAFEAALTFIKDTWEKIKTAFTDAGTFIWTTISTAWDNIKQAISDAMTAIQTTISDIWEGIKTAIDTTLGFIKGIIDGHWNLIKGAASAAWGLISGAVKIGIDAVKGVIDTVMALIRGDWDEAWNSLKGTFEGVWGSMQEIVSAAWTYISGIIDNIIEGVSRAITKLKSMATFGFGGGGGPPKATGGYVRAGVTYPVGERGPEMFTPQRSGYIIPNGGSGGGNTIVVNVSSPLSTEEAAEAMADIVFRNLKLNGMAV